MGKGHFFKEIVSCEINNCLVDENVRLHGYHLHSEGIVKLLAFAGKMLVELLQSSVSSLFPFSVRQYVNSYCLMMPFKTAGGFQDTLRLSNEIGEAVRLRGSPGAGRNQIRN